MSLYSLQAPSLNATDDRFTSREATRIVLRGREKFMGQGCRGKFSLILWELDVYPLRHSSHPHQCTERTLSQRAGECAVNPGQPYSPQQRNGDEKCGQAYRLDIKVRYGS
jgi:hypothetical protein